VQVFFRLTAKLFSATVTAEIVRIPSVLGFGRRSLRIDRHTANWVAFHASPCPMNAESHLIPIRSKHIPGMAHWILGRGLFFN
jgi:hypothetical protein